MIQNRHRGRFVIRLDTLDKHPDIAVAMMQGMIILEATAHLALDEVEYHAVGPMFDEVALGNVIPTYIAHISRDGEAHPTFEIEWKRT